MNSELQSLIQASKGKFFSIKFVKANGQERVANGKNKYNHLLAGGDSTVAARGYSSFVDTNKGDHREGGWIAAHPTRLVEFKCGDIHKIVKV